MDVSFAGVERPIGNRSSWPFHERAFQAKGARPYAAVFYQSAAKYGDEQSRAVVKDAVRKLGIEHTVWDG